MLSYFDTNFGSNKSLNQPEFTQTIFIHLRLCMSTRCQLKVPLFMITCWFIRRYSMKTNEPTFHGETLAARTSIRITFQESWVGKKKSYATTTNGCSTGKTCRSDLYEKHNCSVVASGIHKCRPARHNSTSFHYFFEVFKTVNKQWHSEDCSLPMHDNQSGRSWLRRRYTATHTAKI